MVVTRFRSRTRRPRRSPRLTIDRNLVRQGRRHRRRRQGRRSTACCSRARSRPIDDRDAVQREDEGEQLQLHARQRHRQAAQGGEARGRRNRRRQRAAPRRSVERPDQDERRRAARRQPAFYWTAFSSTYWTFSNLTSPAALRHRHEVIRERQHLRGHRARPRRRSPDTARRTVPSFANALTISTL